MTQQRLAPSLQEIVEALMSGKASAEIQRAAAFLIPEIWRARLPLGISLNKKGHRAKIPWFEDIYFKKYEVDDLFIDEYALVRYMNTGSAAPFIQQYAAIRMAEAVRSYGDLACNGERHRACLRKLPVLKYGALASIFEMAARCEQQGSPHPIRDSMKDAAEAERCGIDRIKRDLREGFEEVRADAQAFATNADAFMSRGVPRSEALALAGQSFLDGCWTPFMLKALYRHAKRKS